LYVEPEPERLPLLGRVEPPLPVFGRERLKMPPNPLELEPELDDLLPRSDREPEPDEPPESLGVRVRSEPPDDDPPPELPFSEPEREEPPELPLSEPPLDLSLEPPLDPPLEPPEGCDGGRERLICASADTVANSSPVAKLSPNVMRPNSRAF